MSSPELQTKILELFYNRWFENIVIGFTKDQVVQTLKAQENEVSHAIELLETMYYIEPVYSDGHKTGYYRITATGIDAYEELLPPSVVSKRVEQRKLVLEILKPFYLDDTEAQVSSEDLAQKTGISNYDELLAVVKYLENKGKVDLQLHLGQSFHVKLNAAGFQSLQEYQFDATRATTNAYMLLFRLENRLRRFVESKLREKYGDEWWEKCASQAVRKQVDDMQKAERDFGWKVSEAKGPTDYLLFGQLEGIIANNWEVFKPILKDQEKITLRLKELEGIRNAIAHTRTLTADAMNRLEQYYNDLMNVTGGS